MMVRGKRPALVLAAVVAMLVGVGAAWAVAAEPVALSGQSPFKSCTGDPAGGTLYDDSAGEPWVAVNPTDQGNIVAAWQQDRWSTGGAGGHVVGVSHNGGRSWHSVVVPGLSVCSGGPYARTSD